MRDTVCFLFFSSGILYLSPASDGVKRWFGLQIPIEPRINTGKHSPDSDSGIPIRVHLCSPVVEPVRKKK